MKLYLPLIVLLLSACSGLPPAVRDAQVINISYEQVSQDVDGYEYTPVRWGGVIIDVENQEDESFVQIMFHPLDSYGRPQLYRAGEGRFVIKSPEFLDPVIYVTDRRITVAGVIEGQIERMVGQKHIFVPLINSSAIHLWPVEYRNNSDYCRHRGLGGGFRGIGGYRGYW